jgi:hypothetical protein
MTDILERLGWGRCDSGPTSDPLECDLTADECHCAILADAAAEIRRLRTLVQIAYNEGFGEGMREYTSSRGGKPWMASAAREAMEVSNGNQ